MRNRTHAVCLIQTAGIALALALAGCASLNDRPAGDGEKVRLVCQPSGETQVHAPGDPHWVGHDVRQLQQVLGIEEMCLGKPSKNMVLIYSRGNGNCIDAYVVDGCNTVVNYFCRPAPIAPMKWGGQSPAPE